MTSTPYNLRTDDCTHVLCCAAMLLYSVVVRGRAPCSLEPVVHLPTIQTPRVSCCTLTCAVQLSRSMTLSALPIKRAGAPEPRFECVRLTRTFLSVLVYCRADVAEAMVITCPMCRTTALCRAVGQRAGCTRTRTEGARPRRTCLTHACPLHAKLSCLQLHSC